MRRKKPVPLGAEMRNPGALKLAARLTDGDVPLTERIALLDKAFPRWLTRLFPPARIVRDVIILLLEILDQSRARQIELEKYAHHDALTGLKNRQYLDASLALFADNTVQHTSEYAFLFIDIDHFKEINDGHGHDVGDAALVEVARRISTIIRNTDEEVIRYGGEEILVWLHETNDSDAMTIAERVRHSIRSTPICGLNITASIGVAIGKPKDKISTIVTHANIAMYFAKHGGRDRVEFFLPSMARRWRQEMRAMPSA